MLSTSPLVSIIITSFNYAQYIGQAIRSVLDQTYDNWELIISDDGSTDNSLEVICSFEDERITVIASPINEGGHPAYRRAYAICQGKYICSLDSDDYIAPDKLEKQVKYLEENPDVDILATFVTEVDANGQPSGDTPWLETWFNQELNLNDPENWTGKHHVNHSSVLMKKAVHDRLGSMNKSLIYLPDYEFWLRALISGANFHVLPEKLMYYRSHDQNTSKDKDPDRFAVEFAYIFCTLLNPYFRKLNRYDLLSRTIYLFVEYEYHQDKQTSENIRANVIERLLTPESEESEFKLFWESMQNMASLEARVSAELIDVFLEKLQVLDKAYQQQTVHVGNLETHAANLETHVTNLETHAANLETHVTNLETHAANLEQLLANKEAHIQNLERRLNNIESTRIWNLASKWYTFKKFLSG